MVGISGCSRMCLLLTANLLVNSRSRCRYNWDRVLEHGCNIMSALAHIKYDTSTHLIYDKVQYVALQKP